MSQHRLLSSGQDSRCLTCGKYFDSDEDPDAFECTEVSPSVPNDRGTKRGSFRYNPLMARRPYTPRHRNA